MVNKNLMLTMKDCKIHTFISCLAKGDDIKKKTGQEIIHSNPWKESGCRKRNGNSSYNLNLEFYMGSDPSPLTILQCTSSREKMNMKFKLKKACNSNTTAGFECPAVCMVYSWTSTLRKWIYTCTISIVDFIVTVHHVKWRLNGH